jgi:hypothetical protein
LRVERHIETIDAPRGTAAHGLRRGKTLILFLLLAVSAIAQRQQELIPTFGIQVKPVVPLDFFDPLTTVERPNLKGEVELMGGFAFGMNVRVALSRSISFETGISQIRRAYDFRLLNDSNGYSDGSRVRFTGYEIPVLGLVYIRLGEHTWMNTALGASIDMYPTDAVRDVEEGRIYIIRHNWVRFGMLANLGVEYRTPKSGTFYLGASYHRPLNDMATAELTYFGPQDFPYPMRTLLDGSYLTLDMRYYFHEDPEGQRMRKRIRDLN